MRYWPSMAWAKAGEREQGGGVDNVEIRGVDGGIRGSIWLHMPRSTKTLGTWARLIDGLVEVEAEAVGGDEEEDAHLLAVVVVDA